MILPLKVDLELITYHPTLKEQFGWPRKTIQICPHCLLTHRDLLVWCSLPVFFLSVWFLLISTLQLFALPNLVKRLVLFLHVLDTSGARRKLGGKTAARQWDSRADPLRGKIFENVQDHNLETPFLLCFNHYENRKTTCNCLQPTINSTPWFHSSRQLCDSGSEISKCHKSVGRVAHFFFL